MVSIGLGKEGLRNGAVRSDSHFDVSCADVGSDGQFPFVQQVLTKTLDVLKARRG